MDIILDYLVTGLVKSRNVMKSVNVPKITTNPKSYNVENVLIYYDNKLKVNDQITYKFNKVVKRIL